MTNNLNYFDYLADVSSPERDSLNEFYKRLDIKSILDNLPDKAVTLLDLGCGLAPYSSFLAPAFKSIVFIDKSKAMLNIAMKSIQSAKSNIKLRALNIDINDLNKKRIEKSCVILATGASLCYQKRTLKEAIEFAYNNLRNYGIFYGDVWNKYGLLISDIYSENFPQLTGDSLIKNINPLKSIIQKGIASEHLDSLTHHIFPTDVTELKNRLISAGFKSVKIWGRKSLSLIFKTELLTRLVVESPKKAEKLEVTLASIKDFFSISPKLTFLAIKED